MRRALREAPPPSADGDGPDVPLTVRAVHIAFLAAVVLTAHYRVVFFGLFLFFLGYTSAYARYQQPLLLKEALLVAFFLAGLVVLGGMQDWCCLLYTSDAADD